MKRLFTLLFAASCLTAFGQVPDYVPTDGLVAWYPLDGNADNASNDNLHGNVDGATPSENRFGVVGQSLFFDGNGDGVFLDHDPVFLSAQQTISLWLQIDEEHFDASTGLGYRLGVLNKTAPDTTNTQNRYFAISMNSEEEPSLQPLGFDVHASTGETYGDRSVASATSPPWPLRRTGISFAEFSKKIPCSRTSMETLLLREVCRARELQTTHRSKSVWTTILPRIETFTDTSTTLGSGIGH